MVVTAHKYKGRERILCHNIYYPGEFVRGNLLVREVAVNWTLWLRRPFPLFLIIFYFEFGNKIVPVFVGGRTQIDEIYYSE